MSLVNKRGLLCALGKLRKARANEMHKMTKAGFTFHAGILANQCAGIDDAITVVKATKTASFQTGIVTQRKRLKS